MKFRRRLIAAMVICCFAAALCGLAACAQPKTAATVPADETALSSTEGTTLPGDFQNRDAGVFSDTNYNTNFVNAGNRGCNSCHEDLWNQMKDLSPLPHLLATPAGYGKAGYSVRDCLPCHKYNVAKGGPKLSDIIHTSHYSNPTFTDEQNGNCWSCHATNLDNEIVLWDEYKYTAEMGGYENASDPQLRDWWLSGRTHENASLMDIAQSDAMNLNVELSQPITDEADMFQAINFPIPNLTPDNYTLKITGVNNERTFTLAELQAMPQTEITVTQTCLTNAIDGTMVGNIPMKGVLLKDVIDACDGVADGNITMATVSHDTWTSAYSVEGLMAQNAIIALEYWGHELTPEQGYPATLVIPGNAGGAFWTKYLAECNFTPNPGPNPWMLFDMLPDVFGGAMCTGWFTPNCDGQMFKAGEPVDISGYASLNAVMGHTMTQVAFSADFGATWTTIDVPADFDQNQWVRWEGTWTPDHAGTYVLHVKAIDSEGVEQYTPASVIVKVTE